MTLFKIILTIIIITITMIIIIEIIISTTIFENITEKLEKVIYFVFTILGVLLSPNVLYITHG